MSEARREIPDRIGRALADRATVHRCDPDRIAATIAGTLAGHDLSRIVTPPGLPVDWYPAALGDQPELPVDQLDQVAGGADQLCLAIVETGTIVLDHGPGQGRRALTLVPDYHLVVVRQEQIVPDAVALLDPRRPLTWISGRAPPVTSSSPGWRACTGRAVSTSSWCWAREADRKEARPYERFVIITKDFQVGRIQDVLPLQIATQAVL